MGGYRALYTDYNRRYNCSILFGSVLGKEMVYLVLSHFSVLFDVFFYVF